jgi:hypothetical protein
MRRLPAVAGLVGITVSAVAADVWATVSAFVAELLEHPVGGCVVVGGLAALGWHLAADPIVKRLSETVVTCGQNR